MKDRFFIKDAAKNVGKTVIIRGWVFNKRSSGSIVFLQVRDGSGFIQVTVVKNEVSPDVFSKAEEVTLESSVIIKGLIQKEKRAPGGYEMSIKNLSIIFFYNMF